MIYVVCPLCGSAELEVLRETPLSPWRLRRRLRCPQGHETVFFLPTGDPAAGPLSVKIS